MKTLSLAPDYLRLTPEIRRNLEALAEFEHPGALKATSNGLKRVSRIQALFQAIKGKLGFTNGCSEKWVAYQARKLLFEVQVNASDTFTPLIHQIQKNQHLKEQYRKIHSLFSQAADDLNQSKQDLIHDYQQLKPCFWIRVFTKPAPFHAKDFGLTSIQRSLAGQTIAEGIDYLSQILKMNLSNEMVVEFFKPSFHRFLKNNPIPSELEPKIASIQMTIAQAQSQLGRAAEAAMTHQLILEANRIGQWSRPLLQRFFQQLIQCNDQRNFLQLYCYAINNHLPREGYRAHFIQTAMHYRTAPGAHLELMQRAFQEASPDEITPAFAQKFLDCYPEGQEKLHTYFLLRQKSPQCVLNIDAPWAAFKRAGEVRACAAVCVVKEDHEELNRVYRERTVKEAQSDLKPSVKDILLFRRGSKKEKALEKFRETFKKAKSDEYNPSWIAPYLELLSKKKELKDELKKVVSKILVICRSKHGTIELLELVLPHTGRKMIARHGANLATLLQRSKLDKAAKMQLLEKILQQGPHPDLYFLKGEWLGNVSTKERLTAYQWAYTYAPDNLLDESVPYYKRDLLVDDPVTLHDIPMYRQLALDAGCIKT